MHVEAHIHGRTWTCQFIQLVYPSEPFDASRCHNPLRSFFYSVSVDPTLPTHCNSTLPKEHLDKGQLGGSDVEGIDVRSQAGVSLLLAIRAVNAC